MKNENVKIREIGEEVTHKASGEKGVVISIYKKCVNKSHKRGIDCLGRLECDMQRVDCYDIATGFGKVVEDVNGFVLV